MTNPKGTALERLVADYLAREVGEENIEVNRGIDRQIRTGKKDKGDIRGVYFHGRRLVIEVKNVAKLNLGGWVNEAEVERGNADALAGMVVHKRRGYGDKTLGGTYVTMTLADLVALLTGHRP